jgi:hypothetical protein
MDVDAARFAGRLRRTYIDAARFAGGFDPSSRPPGSPGGLVHPPQLRLRWRG